MNFKKRLVIVAALGLLLGYLAAGTAGYEQALSEEKHYCEMVAAGTWPAYNPSIKC